MKKFTFLKNAMHGLAIKSMLLVVFLLSLGTSDALAANKPYAVFDDATKTLTFKYGEKETLGTNEYWLDGAKWTSLNITKAVFEPSFADARPTTCKNWFVFGANLAFFIEQRCPLPSLLCPLATKKVSTSYEVDT